MKALMILSLMALSFSSFAAKEPGEQSGSTDCAFVKQERVDKKEEPTLDNTQVVEGKKGTGK